jgi:WD40 repeat protein
MEELSEFEKKRQENIQRNAQVLKELGLLSPTSQPKRLPPAKKSTPHKKPRIARSPPEPQRRSRRLQDIPPEIKTEPQEDQENKIEVKKEAFEGPGPVSKDSASFLETIEGYEYTEPNYELIAEEKDLLAELESLKVSYSHGEYVKVVNSRITCMTWHPNPERLILTVGDRNGWIGFWDAKASNALEYNENNPLDFSGCISRLHPHADGLSEVTFDPKNAGRLFSSGYDGAIQSLDLEATRFNEVYRCEHGSPIQCMDIAATGNELLLGKRSGDVVYWDLRSLQSIQVFQVSDKKVGSVHWNPKQPNYFLTASLDQTCQLWDIRNGTEPLHVYSHGKSCTSAYWNPIGTAFVTTSYDDTIKIFESPMDAMVPSKIMRHGNKTGRWVTNFRAKYHPHPGKPLVVIGNMSRPLDIYSGTTGRLLTQLYDPDCVTAIQAVTAIHPHTGHSVIASGNASGKCLIWA